MSRTASIVIVISIARTKKRSAKIAFVPKGPLVGVHTVHWSIAKGATVLIITLALEALAVTGGARCTAIHNAGIHFLGRCRRHLAGGDCYRAARLRSRDRVQLGGANTSLVGGMSTTSWLPHSSRCDHNVAIYLAISPDGRLYHGNAVPRVTAIICSSLILLIIAVCIPVAGLV